MPPPKTNFDGVIEVAQAKLNGYWVSSGPGAGQSQGSAKAGNDPAAFPLPAGGAKLVADVTSIPSTLNLMGGGRLDTETVTEGGNTGGNVGYGPVPGAAQLRWRERVANYSPWNDVFSVEQQETSLVVDVPFENRYLFIPWAIGYAWVEGVRLKRINPVRHPYWNWMRAARVAHIGVRYAGSKIFVPPLGGPAGTKANKQDTSYYGVARYKLARFTIGFANYPWDFYEDDEITADEEWKRNVYWEEQPTAQMLAAEGGASTLTFCHTPSAGGPAAGTNFRASFGTPVPQTRFVLNWKWVPYDFVYDGRLSTNLLSAVFTLNDSDAFRGPSGAAYPKGTLLFEPGSIHKYVYPVRTRGTVAYMCDVKIPVLFMDPPRGLAPTDAGYAVRGHNLMPFRENNKWYPATRRVGGAVSTDTDTRGLYLHSDWKNLFRRAAPAV